jgi:hypothetical protein
MRLDSTNGVGQLEVTVAGYEFPDDLSELSAANWLEVDVSVRTPHGWGTSRVACMQTWSAADFADWLAALGAGRIVGKSNMLFSEPNLQFQTGAQTAQEVTVHVWFILELPGEWQMDDAPDADSRHYIGEMDITVPRAALRTAAESLRTELWDFPVRKTKS